MSNKSSLYDSKINLSYFSNPRPEMLEFIPNDALRILEVGCGKGSFCYDIKREDREIWGLEINPEIAREAESICNRVLVGDINSIYKELPSNYFDCIIFNDVLEHLYAPWDTISLMKDILSPKGVIVTSIPNFRYISNLVTEIIFQKDFRYKPEGGILDDTHIRFFTSKSILRMFSEQGYEVITHKGIRPCRSWKEKLFITLSCGIFSDSRYKQFATVAKPSK